jgi:hypothetical protein
MATQRVRQCVDNGAALGGNETVPQTAFPGNILWGDTTARAILAGEVGELKEAYAGSTVSLTTATIADITSLGLTKGVWEATVVARFAPAATTTITDLEAFIGTATGNVSTGRDYDRNVARLKFNALVLNAGETIISSPPFRITLATDTTYYAKAVATFATSTLTVRGGIRAVRIK